MFPLLSEHWGTDVVGPARLKGDPSTKEAVVASTMRTEERIVRWNVLVVILLSLD